MVTPARGGCVKIYMKRGYKVKFQREVQKYTIRATDGNRFAVCTKPFNVHKTVLYTIIDLHKDIRGTENMWAMGAETDQECNEMLERLVSGESEVSGRNYVDLDIAYFEFNKRRVMA